MSNNKHTPAPWVDGGIRGSINSECGKHITLVNFGMNRNEKGEPIGISDEEFQHNLSLIKAAPDLLDALNEFIKAGIGNSTNFENQKIAFSKAQAAITKLRVRSGYDC